MKPQNNDQLVRQLVSVIAYHEAGHAVATVRMFREASWLPMAPPPLLLKYVEITDVEGTLKKSGMCYGPDIYSTRWPAEKRLKQHYRDLMERQIVINMAGGIAEAIHRGERSRENAFWFAMFNCEIDGDLEQSAAILNDLRAVTKRRHSERRFADQAYQVIKAHWSAVDALALELIEHRFIDGERALEIIDGASK